MLANMISRMLKFSLALYVGLGVLFCFHRSLLIDLDVSHSGKSATIRESIHG